MRRVNDFYPTPAGAVTSLLSEADLPLGRWLEPAAGNGAIIRAVDSVLPGIEWLGLDIHPRGPQDFNSVVWKGDFLAQRPDEVVSELFDVSISNPPYRYALEFVERSILVAKHTVMLLRLAFLESRKRSAFLRANMPDVYILPNRPSFTGDGRSDSHAYAWFHWWAGQAGKLRILPDADVRTSEQGYCERWRVAA